MNNECGPAGVYWKLVLFLKRQICLKYAQHLQLLIVQAGCMQRVDLMVNIA